MATLPRPKTYTELSERFLPTMDNRGIDKKSVEMLARVFENWLLGDEAVSSSQIRSQFFSAHDRFNALTHRLARETNKRFDPSFEAFAILLVHRKKCAIRLRPAMDWALRHAGDRLKTDPDEPHATVEEFLANAPQGVTPEDFSFALKLLASSSFGIHSGRDRDDKPLVTYILEVRHYPDTLAAAAQYLDMTAGPEMRPGPLELTTFSLDALSIAPEAHANAAKAMERAATDASGAITSARATLEATLKWIAHEHGIEIGKNPSLQDLLSLCKAPLGLDSAITADLMRAVTTLGQRIFEIRNNFGDAHGPLPKAGKASRSEARYVTSSSLLLAAYLLERYEAKNTV